MSIVLDGTSGITAPAIDAVLDGADLTAGSVVQAKLETLVVPIGVGQTWQNVLASRATLTNYTNSTGRPIMVAVAAGMATYSYIDGIVDGLTVITQRGRDADTTQSLASIAFIVPAGSTYQITVNVNGSTTSLTSWFELR